MPSGEEEEIAEREAPLFFFTAPAAPAFLVFLTCYPSSSRTQPAKSKLDPWQPCKRSFVLRQRLFEHFVPRVKGLMLKVAPAEGCPVHLVCAGASASICTIAATCGSIRRTARTGVVDHDAELDSIVDPAEPADKSWRMNGLFGRLISPFIRV